MSVELKNLATEMTTHPKMVSFMSWLIVTLTNCANFYVDYASPIVTATIPVLSVILIFTGIRLNISNKKKIDMELRKADEELKAIKEKLIALESKSNDS